MNDNARFALVAVVVVAVVGAFLWFVYGSAPSEPNAPAPETAPVAQADKPVEVAPFEETPAAEAPAEEAAATVTPAVNTDRPAPRKQRPSGIGSIEGEVVWKKDDGPAAGAEVTIELQDWEPSATIPNRDKVTWTATTDGDGKFAVPRLPAKGLYSGEAWRYFISATKDDAFGMSSVALTTDEFDGYVKIELDEVGSIAGRVVNAEGAPVADAFVFPDEGEEDRRVDGTALRVVSDAEGKFELVHLPVAKWKIAVRAAGYAVKTTDLIATDTRDVEIVLSKGGSITGVVAMAQGGAPVPDIKVALASDEGRWNRHSATTDANGAFTFEALADASYRLSLDDRERIMVGEAPNLTIAHENALDDVKLLVALGGVVTGRTYDADTLEPIANVSIRDLNRQGSGSTAHDAVSDADGNYRMTGLTEGGHTLRRRWKPGYLHGEQREDKSVSLSLGQEVNGIDFPIKKGLYLRGIVVDAEGNPIERVDVTSDDMSGKDEGESTVSKRDGTFEHRGFSEGTQVTVTARREGFSAEPVGPLTIGPEGLSDVKIVMQPGASIAGIVVDKLGKPVGSVYVTAQSERSVSGDSSGSDGTFNVEGLAPGTYTMTLRRNSSGYRRDARSGDPVTLAQGQKLTGLRLVLDEKEGLSISGRVMDSNRKPIKDAQVNAHSRSGGDSYGYDQSKEDGTYEIVGLAEGPHQMYVSHGDYSFKQLDEVAAGARNVDFVLEDQATVEGRVIDARTGRPITTFQVGYINGSAEHVNFSWSQSAFQNATTYFDDNGAFTLTKVNAGDVVVFGRAEGYAPGTDALPNVRPGEVVTGVEIRLEAGAAVRGVVVDSRGVPVSGAQVFPGDVPRDQWSRENSGGTTTDSNGIFELTSLAPDVTRIGAYHAKYPPSSVDVSLAAGQTIQVEIMLTDGGAVEGTVRLGGKPITAQIYAGRSDGSQGQNVAADANGVYTLGGLAEGEYHISASIQIPGGGNRNGQQQATVQTGMVTEVNFDFTTGDATVEGVVTMNGTPVTEGHVGAMMSNAESVGSQLGADGSYRLEGLPAGAISLFLGVRSGDAWVSRSIPVETVSGQVVRRNIEVTDGVEITGSVTGHTEGDSVFVIALRGEVQITEMTQNVLMELRELFAAQAQVTGGAFELSGLEPGTYTIIAVDMGNPQSGQMSMENARFGTVVREINSEGQTVEIRIP